MENVQNSYRVLNPCADVAKWIAEKLVPRGKSVPDKCCYSGAIAGEVTKYVQGLEGESKVYVMVGNGWIRVPLKRGSYSLCGALLLPLSTRTRSIRSTFYGTETLSNGQVGQAECGRVGGDLSDGPRVGWSDVSRTSLRGSSISSP